MGKERRRVLVGTYVPQDFKDQLEELAEENDESVSRLVRRVLAKHLEAAS